MADPILQGPLSAAVTDPDTPSQTASAPLSGPYKMTGGGKGTVSTITPTAGMVLDEESNKSILANMQKMLAEYESPKKGLDDALMKAHAWTMYNKVPAFQQIQQQEEQDRTNKYNIAQNMATIQAMSNQGKKLSDYWNQPVDDKGNLVAQNTGAPVSKATRFQQSIAGAPEAIRNQAQSLFDRGYVDAALQKVADYEIKGKPNEVKILDTLKGMDYTPQNEAWARQNFPKLFEPAKRVINGVATEYSPDAASLFKQPGTTTQPPISNVKAEIKAATEPTIGSPQGTRNVPGVGVGVHNGIDMPMPAGTAVNSFTSGKVLSAGDAGDGFGKSVVVQNADGTTTRYAHLSDIGVKPNDTIDRNSPLGAAGQTGKATGPHLHVEVRDGKGQPLDAKNYLAGASKSPARPLTPGEQDTSVPGVEQQYKNIAVTNEAVGKVYKDLTDNKTMYQDAADSAKMAIKAVDEGKGEEQGPGSSIKQSYIFAKIAAGVPVDPEELARYSRNLTIEQAKQQYVAHGAKAAMGAQYTGKEADNFAKSLASINDPAEFVKTTFQIMQAKNEVNLAHLRFLDKYPKDLAGGERAWDASGERERIFKDAVTAFNKTPAATKAPNIKGDATKHFGSYDPNKYNYGYENGKFYREEK